MASNFLFLLILLIKNLNLTFALVCYSISNSISSIFIINNFRFYVHFVNQGLFFSGFIIQNFLSIFLRKLIKCFLLFGIQDFILRDNDIESFNFNTKIITSCCSVSSLSVSCLNDEHSLAICYVFLKETWAIANCLIGFSV